MAVAHVPARFRAGAQLLTIIDPMRLRSVVLFLLVASIVGTFWAGRRPKTVNVSPSAMQRFTGFVLVLVLAVYSGFSAPAMASS